MTFTLLALIGYLVGSIPSSYLAMRFFTGVDIRSVGTGEATVTAVGARGGKRPAIVAALGEFTKAALCILIAHVLVGELWASLVVVTAAVFGSSWSVWLKGNGGQGQCIMALGFLILSPIAFFVAAAFYLLPLAITRRHFLSNQIFHLAIPAVLGLWNGSWEWAVAGSLIVAPFFVKQWAVGGNVLQAGNVNGVDHNRARAS